MKTDTTDVIVCLRVRITGKRKKDIQAAVRQIKIDTKQEGSISSNVGCFEYDYRTIGKVDVTYDQRN